MIDTDVATSRFTLTAVGSRTWLAQNRHYRLVNEQTCPHADTAGGTVRIIWRELRDVGC